ncbi:hypothetical protein [Candidatus Magnetaquicoccus inordinatus]|uniref:hypothetical protein n=1 Tax=Candidatus Magnetaquicoccus inordinatus TaxID=2496818 RepID=UPI00102C57FA|nr:hypothetical protein [Candidatus Magnetaquicoccus inordinatus]
MNISFAHSSLAINELLNRLAKRARNERLEAALPLITALRIAFAPERRLPGVPMGVLTVTEWFDLLNRWEELLVSVPQRRIHFMRAFFMEVIVSMPPDTPTSLLQALQELVGMMDQTLAQLGKDAEGEEEKM